MRLWPWQWPHRRPYSEVGRLLDAADAAAARRRLLAQAKSLPDGSQ